MGSLFMTLAAVSPPMPSLGAHAVLTLLVELAVLVALARLLAEVARRLDQPAVIGELLAGIVIGPSVFGALAPGAFRTLFPPNVEQFHLIEAVSWLGVVLLLLLTGLETDVRAMRAIGRPALLTSLFGMVVPFAGGFALGMALPDALVGNAANRPLFAVFLATTMTISAMAVIAKILLDLKLLKRDVGMVMLSAGIVDDMVGWILLSVISGIAASGVFEPMRVLRVVAMTAAFLAACIYLLLPLSKVILKYVDDRKQIAGTDLAVIVVLTLAVASIAEAIGIHAVFGAFMAGVTLRQVPRLRWRSVHQLDAVVQAVFAPVFFAFVGLRVDLSAVTNLGLVAAVLVIAIVTKVVGCGVGARLGGMTGWESLAVGIGMSTRGSMELVVALVGLSLGILTVEMYSVVVLMAVATPLITPPFLRLVVGRIKLRDSEKKRVEGDLTRTHFRKDRIKILVPMAGGPNATQALSIGAALARHTGSTLCVLHVDAKGRPGLRERVRGWLQRQPAPVARSAVVLANAALTAGEWGVKVDPRQVEAKDIAEAIIEESRRGYDLLMLGASDRRRFHRNVLQDVISKCPCHVAILQSKDREPRKAYKEILVPSEGSYFALVAFELAAAYAEEVGARVTLLHVIETHEPIPGGFDMVGLIDIARADRMRESLRAGIHPILQRFKVEVDVRVTEGASVNSAIVREVTRGPYDLVIIGAENRSVVDRLFLGYGTEYVIEQAPCTVMVLLPEGISGPSGRTTSAGPGTTLVAARVVPTA